MVEHLIDFASFERIQSIESELLECGETVPIRADQEGPLPLVVGLSHDPELFFDCRSVFIEGLRAVSEGAIPIPLDRARRAVDEEINTWETGTRLSKQTEGWDSVIVVVDKSESV